MARKTIQKSKKGKKAQAGLTLDNTPMLPTDMQNMNPYNWISAKNSTPTKDNKKDLGKMPNYGDVALQALLAIDAFLPKERSPYPIVRPALGYNENPGGVYGSQAIAQDGITLSETGYKKNSKDRNKKQLRIPSNKITMKDVPHPVLGIDSLGNQQIMMPGQDYQFDGQYVDEYPLARKGKTINSKKNTYMAKDGLTILDDTTVQFNGDKHSDASGGIPIAYGGKKVMVEGEETGYISPVDGSLSVMGNLVNPITGRKFKSDSKILSQKEQKMDALMAEGLELINTSNPADKWEALKFNSGKAMALGAHKKKQELMQSKEHLKALQQAMLETMPQDGTAKNGITIAQDGYTSPRRRRGSKASVTPLEEILDNYVSPRNRRKTKTSPTVLDGLGTRVGTGLEGVDDNYISPRTKRNAKPSVVTPPTSANTSPTNWQYNQTNTQGLDAKIQEFVSLLEKKGMTGYSGPESGVSKRNTKSGRASRHASGEALDVFMSQPDAYNKVLQDPDLSKYLIDNGLTVINEYDPDVASKTGATAGHLHIGYDKGTGVSDAFRNQASQLYGKDHPDWAWSTRRNPRGKTIQGAPSGDAQYFPYDAGRVDWKDVTTVPSDNNTNPTPKRGPNPDFNFTNPPRRNIPSDAQPLEFEQVLPELYAAATNKTDPVHLQKYQPQLYQPYNVSFQDQLNENQASFSSMSRAAAYNPSALATLGAGKYSADSSVLANEFRTNQAVASDITNKNISLMNNAELKNLELADVQYVRQSQAKSNTKAINHGVLNSISSKLLQNEANNRRLQVYENLYDYRYDEDNNNQLEYLGAPGQEYVDWTGGEGNSGYGGNESLRTRRNAQGNVQSTTTTTPSPTKTQLDYERLRNLRQENVNKFFNKNKGKPVSIFDLYHQ